MSSPRPSQDTSRLSQTDVRVNCSDKNSDVTAAFGRALNEKKHDVDVDGKTITRHVTHEFDVYGDEEAADIQYRTMVWWKAAALMLAETVSLGILSLPSVFATLGIVGGCILVLTLGAAATASGYVIGKFKLRYPHVHNMADAGEILAGPIGREFLGAAQVVFMVFICASHVLTGKIAFDTFTAGASCSVLWAAICAIVSLVCTLPRTLNGMSHMSVISFVSILAAVFITMIGVGVTGHTGNISVTVAPNLSFANGFLAFTNIIFAYAGHVAFFTFIAEMKVPEDFPKALYVLQIADTTLYLVVGVVVYAYVGSTAVSPALGNTGLTLRKIAYGIAMPTIIIAGVINGHVCAKMVFIRIFRRDGVKSKHMTSNSLIGWATWVGICVAIWVLAFVIAEVIPFFNGLLGIISSMFATWFTYGISGIFWFYLTPRSEYWSSTKQKLKALFWGFVILFCAFVMVAGFYASVASIIDGYKTGGFKGPFSCTSSALV
ncbi:unnamed protein product [Somion occarium]|uniref:Amino acid transporter transmembrane domain-containing protein n=1 Tax=Somion occarium TaxID=3059160 RepID=A0ABP1DFK0_9APHY